MQTYSAPPSRNTAMASSAPQPQRAAPLSQAPALAVVAAPTGAPAADPSACCKDVAGFSNTTLKPGMV